MATFLFWNLNHKPLQSLVATLAVQHEVDVLIFAECSIKPNLLLESLREAGGEYHYVKSVHKNFFWNMFDQVLIRPELLSSFSHDSLQILTAIGNTSLLSKNGRPNLKVASDHLPLLFTLQLNEEVTT